MQISEMIWFWRAVFYFVYLVYKFVHCCFTSQLKKSDNVQKQIAKLTAGHKEEIFDLFFYYYVLRGEQIKCNMHVFSARVTILCRFAIK